MKKILIAFFVCLLLCSCSKQDDSEVQYTYDVVTKPVDMSDYDGLSSTEHMFVGVTVQEFYNVVDNGSSGVFYLGRTNCGCCQSTVQYLNEVATNLNVTVYYLNVYDSEMPINTDEQINKITEYLYDVIEEVDGEKEVQTPTVFSVINGKVTEGLVCLSNWAWDDPPTESQIKKLENRYTEILMPFSK